MSLFQNKYRIESTRLQDYDYSSEGWYFVTICTQDREYYFGNVVDSKMQSSKSNKFGPQSKNLASIMRGFKTGVKKYATTSNILFQWQSRFYDHIIWERDRNNLENLYM